MKLKKYSDLIEEQSDREWKMPEEEEEDDEINGNVSDDIQASTEEDDEPTEEDDTEYLFYLLRQIFKNANLEEVYVTGTVNNIVIEVCTSIFEPLKDIIKIFDIVRSKLRDDILAEYEVEFELAADRSGSPVYVFNFSVGYGGEEEEEEREEREESELKSMISRETPAYMSDELDKGGLPF